MARYRFTNLCTMYEASLNGSLFGNDFRERMCYGTSLQLLNARTNYVTYTIILITDESYVNRGKLNYCSMEKHQLENYLRRITSVKPFKYKVETSTFNEAPCFRVTIAMSGTKKEITFVLQCIKRTYEWPYNFFLQQAYEMQKLPAFKFDSILNLYNVAFSAYWEYQNTDHSFSGNTAFEKYVTLRHKLPTVNLTANIYPREVYTTRRAPRIEGISYSNRVPNDTKQWNDDFFKQVLPTYIANYHEMKK